MTKHDDEFHLEGIKHHIDAIRAYLPDSKDAFLADQRTQDALLMRLLALGEELGNLSDSFVETHPSVKWYQIIGLRNRIAHGYFEIDPEIIWDTLSGSSLEELESLISSDPQSR